jgi:D-xylulose reductase
MWMAVRLFHFRVSAREVEMKADRLLDALFPEGKRQQRRLPGVANGVDNVIEVSGAASAIQIGIYVLRNGGSYIQTGMSGKPKVEFPIHAFSAKDLNLKGCYRYGPGDYELALRLLTTRNISVKELVSSVTPFERAPKEWEDRQEGIKNLIEVTN